MLSLKQGQTDPYRIVKAALCGTLLIAEVLNPGQFCPSSGQSPRGDFRQCLETFSRLSQLRGGATSYSS